MRTISGPITIQSDASFRTVSQAAFIISDRYGEIASGSRVIEPGRAQSAACELAAVIIAMELLIERNLTHRPIILQSDNKEFRNQFRKLKAKGGTTKNATLRPLFNKIMELATLFPDVSPDWQPRTLMWQVDKLSRSDTPQATLWKPTF